MLIRSQNKISLVKVENIIININNINGKEIICWSQMNPGEDEYISLGHYSTKAKAMKVLDMIQEAYADEKIVDYTTYLQRKEIEKMDDSTILALRNELMKKAVFQMPEDSEVEA